MLRKTSARRKRAKNLAPHRADFFQPFVQVVDVSQVARAGVRIHFGVEVGRRGQRQVNGVVRDGAHVGGVGGDDSLDGFADGEGAFGFGKRGGLRGGGALSDFSESEPILSAGGAEGGHFAGLDAAVYFARREPGQRRNFGDGQILASAIINRQRGTTGGGADSGEIGGNSMEANFPRK